MTDQTFDVPPGLIAITTHGAIQASTASSIWEARSFMEANGVKNIRWATVPGGLVDKARNDACRMMLNENLGFVLFVDGDMTFDPQTLFRVLQTAYGTHKWADVTGGYCNLRGDMAISTIDTGTGTWEVHYPNSGVKEVIRTGGALLLVKRHVCERIPQPWFALRVPMKPLDAMTELDNFARCKFDGANPFQSMPEWAVLESIAAGDTNFVPAEVGEDSGFCDRVKAHGMRIVVDTHAVTGHLGQVTFNWKNLKKEITKRDTQQRHLVGLTR